MAERNDKPRHRVTESPAQKPARPFPYHRHLKVHPGLYHYPSTHLPRPHRPPVPWVHLKGYWLAEAGFGVHTRLQVEVSEGCLVLTAEPDTP